MLDSTSKPLFCFEVLQGAFLFHRHLFREDIEALLNSVGFRGSNIYYLVRAPKVRFIHDQCAINDQTLKVSLSVGATRTINAELPLNQLYPFCQSPVIENFRFDVEVAPNQTDLQVLEICPATDKSKSIPIDVSALLGSVDINIGSKPEVLYVGQSTDILHRWKNHKQVNRALAILDDDSELRLYFLNFTFMGEFEDFGDAYFNNLLDTKNRESEEFRDRISIIEQTLIQFYKPELNTQHVSGSSETASFKRIFDKIGLENIGFSIGMYGYAFQFWSPQQILKTEIGTLSRHKGELVFNDELFIDHFPPTDNR